MEWIKIDPIPPAPKTAVSTVSGGIRVTLRPREGDSVVSVTASDAAGRDVPIEKLGENVYGLPKTAEGVVTVRIKSAKGAERTESLFAGDFGAALRLLATERAGAVGPEKADFAVWLRGVAANWHDTKLAALLAAADPARDPVSGAVVEDYRYLVEVTKALKTADVAAAYRGRELPIRASLPASANHGAATFDALLRLPTGVANSEAAPLLLRLHGYTPQPALEGARLDLARVGWPGDFPFVVVSPVCNKVMGEENWNTAELGSLVEELRTKLPVDAAKVFVTGFSMGGYTTLKLANERPDLFAAWAAVCGWGDTLNLNGAAKRPGWLIHGDRDPVVLPYESVRVYRTLRAMGAPTRLSIYGGVDHNSWDPAYRQAAFYEWLLAQAGTGSARAPVVGEEAAERLVVTDRSWALGELMSGDTLETVSRGLYALYPAQALVGDVTVFAPHGFSSPDAPCVVGVPVKGDASPPAGFKLVQKPKAEGRVFTRQFPVDADVIARAAAQGQPGPVVLRIGGIEKKRRRISAELTWVTAAPVLTREEIDAMPLIEVHCHVFSSPKGWTVGEAVALQNSERLRYALLIIEPEQKLIDETREHRERAGALLWANPKEAGWVENLEALWRANRDVVRGFKLHPTGGGYDVKPELLEPLFALAEKEGLLIVTHTDNGRSRAGQYRPLLEKHPGVKIVFYHASPADEVIGLVRDFANAYLDMSYLGWGRDYQQRILRAVGSDRILFGIDSPLGFPRTENGFGKHYRDAAAEVAAFYDNRRDVVEAVLYRNAARLLGLSVEKAETPSQ